MEPFSFGEPQRHRRASLTPMIDVVFLLLVFFMLAARFGADEAVDLTVAEGSGAYQGPPRLVEVSPGGLSLNGVPVAEAALAGTLKRLVESPGDLVVLRGGGGADTQAIVAALDLLAAGGFGNIALVE